MAYPKIICIVALLAALLIFPALAESGADEGGSAEWTVLFYLCGSDLESQYSLATGNLKEIDSVIYPDNYLQIMLRDQGVISDQVTATQPGKVNLLIETGGAREWHAQELGMDVDPRAIQRWRYNVYALDEWMMGLENGYELMETLPLQSMAEPGTLSDFIRWGTQTCPAKKYALVIWGHGDGARSGIFADELFNMDMLYLYEMKQALADGGAHFETLVIDACLMASIETAWNVRDHARWMVASEEIVPGNGTAIGDWLQELYCYPDCDGEWLGRCICDTTAIKYANKTDIKSSDILTWSVIDLSKVDDVLECCGRFIDALGEALKKYPEVANIYMRAIFESQEYGDGLQNMRDIGSLIYNRDLVLFLDLDLRNAAVKALSDAVDYCVRGPGRREARGLTFCYPADFDDEEMAIYVKNFPMPLYLAYLDAVSSWTAPDWVYDSVERLPQIADIEMLQTTIEKKLSRDGMPGIVICSDPFNVNSVCYSLYWLNDQTGETVCLGRTNCQGESVSDTELLWRAFDPMHWPAIQGQLICMDLIQVQDDMKLYNVPVMINGQVCLARCGRNVTYSTQAGERRINDYEIYGIWLGYDADSTLMNRSVQPLSGLAGQEFQLLYPIDGTREKGRTLYESSTPLTIYRTLDVTEKPLPAGTYYLEYEINDVFMRKSVLDRIEIRYDGQNMTFPQGTQWADGVQINLSKHDDR